MLMMTEQQIYTRAIVRVLSNRNTLPPNQLEHYANKLAVIMINLKHTGKTNEKRTRIHLNHGAVHHSP